jgi:hypothetical protein
VSLLGSAYSYVFHLAIIAMTLEGRGLRNWTCDETVVELGGNNGAGIGKVVDNMLKLHKEHLHGDAHIGKPVCYLFYSIMCVRLMSW